MLGWRTLQNRLGGFKMAEGNQGKLLNIAAKKATQIYPCRHEKFILKFGGNFAFT